MANYNYDESGNMAAYFVLTFLSIFLVPYTLAAFSATSAHHWKRVPSARLPQE